MNGLPHLSHLKCLCLSSLDATDSVGKSVFFASFESYSAWTVSNETFLFFLIGTPDVLAGLFRKLSLPCSEMATIDN